MWFMILLTVQCPRRENHEWRNVINVPFSCCILL